MSNSFGKELKITLFGESHGEAVGAVLDGLPSGIEINEEKIAEKLTLRRPSGDISTQRRETDEFKIVSGIFSGVSTGAPITVLIPNTNTRSKDYESDRYIPRPSHADFTAFIKYEGREDYRGGGHFSGRLTAPIVALGAIVLTALEKEGVKIGTHIKSIKNITDREFSNFEADIDFLQNKTFPVLDETAGEKMKAEILKAKESLDSVGGILETVVMGLETGLGEPWFDSVESELSHALFSIPAVKGVEFGDGFSITEKNGSQVNDAFFYDENGVISTKTNHSGGILGGITNSQPILFRVAVKPTPTIALKQETVDLKTGENITHSFLGRHDPCIVHRARAVVDAMAAITLYDLILRRKARKN